MMLLQKLPRISFAILVGNHVMLSLYSFRLQIFCKSYNNPNLLFFLLPSPNFSLIFSSLTPTLAHSTPLDLNCHVFFLLFLLLFCFNTKLVLSFHLLIINVPWDDLTVVRRTSGSPLFIIIISFFFFFF